MTNGVLERQPKINNNQTTCLASLWARAQAAFELQKLGEHNYMSFSSINCAERAIVLFDIISQSKINGFSPSVTS